MYMCVLVGLITAINTSGTGERILLIASYSSPSKEDHDQVACSKLLVGVDDRKSVGVGRGCASFFPGLAGRPRGFSIAPTVRETGTAYDKVYENV